MAHIAPLNLSRNKAGSGKTGVVFLKLEPAAGYKLIACKPPVVGEVYKVAINSDQDVLDEVRASDIVRKAFQDTGNLYTFTPLLPVKIMTVTWVKTTNRASTGIIHYIPLKRFRMDGYKLLFSAIGDDKQFVKSLHGVLFVFLRFLNVLHRKGVLHMDIGLQNSLFNSPARPDQGVVCDFQGVTKRLKLGNVLYGDAWTSPLLAKCVPREASKNTYDMWCETGFGRMFSIWEKHSALNKVDIKVSKNNRQYIDFHCLASSLMRCVLYMQGHKAHKSQKNMMQAVISCLISDPRQLNKRVQGHENARSVFVRIQEIILPNQSDAWVSFPRSSKP